jgi:hypothetical protein
MTDKPPRPGAFNEAHRAGSGISGQDFRAPFITADPSNLARVLRQGATLTIGLHKHRLGLAHFQAFLGDVFPRYDPRQRDELLGRQRDELLGRVALTAHWFSFCRRSNRLNCAYSLAILAHMIENCFGLAHGTITDEALLVGLVDCCFSLQRPTGRGSYLVTNISNKACSPNNPLKLIRLADLGKPGAVPSISIEWGDQWTTK